MHKKELILLTDAIFKSMFKDSIYFRKMLERIFKYYFDFSFEDYNLTSEELSIFNEKEIKNRVDILMNQENIDYFLNIEVNNGNYKESYNRNLLYEAKLILYIFRKRSDYKKDFKIIQININNIKCPVDEEITDSTLIMYDRKNEIKDERVITHNLYLGKYKKIDYNNLNEIEKDLAMLVCEDINKMKELAKDDEVRLKVMNEFEKKISDKELFEELFDPEEDKRMWQNTFKNEGIEEGIEKGKKEGLEQGIELGLEQGKKENQISTAKKMLEKKMDIDVISEITNLSIKEIEQLK